MSSIGALIPIVAIICGTIILVAPFIIVMHYMTRWRASKGLSADDERLLEDLWRTAQALEKRIETMETILRRDHPDGGAMPEGVPWPDGRRRREGRDWDD
jgi:phage shock protein B